MWNCSLAQHQCTMLLLLCTGLLHLQADVSTNGSSFSYSALLCGRLLVFYFGSSISLQYVISLIDIYNPLRDGRHLIAQYHTPCFVYKHWACNARSKIKKYNNLCHIPVSQKYLWCVCSGTQWPLINFFFFKLIVSGFFLSWNVHLLISRLLMSKEQWQKLTVSCAGRYIFIRLCHIASYGC